MQNEASKLEEVFADTPRGNKKDYVMGSHSKTFETYYSLEQSFFSWKKKCSFVISLSLFAWFYIWFWNFVNPKSGKNT